MLVEIGAQLGFSGMKIQALISFTGVDRKYSFTALLLGQLTKQYHLS